VVLLCSILTTTGYCINYMYFTETERTVFTDWIKFWHGDTLMGPVRSNDSIAIMQDPVFYDYVITSEPGFFRGSAFNPQFRDYGAVIFNAPYLILPTHLNSFREQAIAQGHYFFAGETMQARVVCGDHNLRIWWTPEGWPFDTLLFTDHPLPDSAIVYFDCPDVRISGVVSRILILCAAGRIGLEDNLIYASSDPITGAVALGHPEKLAVMAEGEIKILNTVANGRENSGGAGWNQTNPALTSIALNGIFVALNESFTFENQNDPDSGYVCDCQPDDRGTIYLTGSLIQKRHGYVHRSTRSSTGYLKKYKYDEDLRYWDLGLWNIPENLMDRTALDFGEVVVGDTIRDTISVFNGYVPPRLDSIHVSAPFYCALTQDSFRFEHHLPIAFIPATAGDFTDTLRFYMPYYEQWFTVPLSGTSIVNRADDSFTPHPSSFNLSAYPNPFNARTTLSFSLEKASQVTLKLYDLQGRLAATLLDETKAAGDYQISFDGGNLATGVYLARLTAGDRQITTKLLLVK
ncbi:MAG: T9SS type A sorting domain-containing protein, partial [Calditrichota bacterium]